MFVDFFKSLSAKKIKHNGREVVMKTFSVDIDLFSPMNRHLLISSSTPA